MPKTELKDVERAQLVRMYGDNCAIDFPKSFDLNFRLSLMAKLKETFGLAPMHRFIVSDQEKAAALGQAPAPAPAPTQPPTRAPARKQEAK